MPGPKIFSRCTFTSMFTASHFVPRVIVSKFTCFAIRCTMVAGNVLKGSVLNDSIHRALQLGFFCLGQFVSVFPYSNPLTLVGQWSWKGTYIIIKTVLMYVSIMSFRQVVKCWNWCLVECRNLYLRKVEPIAVELFKWNHETFSNSWKCPKIHFMATFTEHKNENHSIFNTDFDIQWPVQMTWSTVTLVETYCFCIGNVH